MMKQLQREDSKQHVKKSEIKVGDKVLCRQQRLMKHTPANSNEILRVIKRKGSLIVAKGETRTITRHAAFFKRVPHDLDADTPMPTPDQATPALAEATLLRLLLQRRPCQNKLKMKNCNNEMICR